MDDLTETTTKYTTEQLRRMLAEAEARDREVRQAALDAVKPRMAYSIKHSEAPTREVFADSGCSVWMLSGELLNYDDMRNAGHSVEPGGGMAYLFNDATGRFVCSLGGGTVYLGFAHGELTEAQVDAFDRLAAFVRAFPEGGDVTDIVEAYKAAAEAR